MQTRVESNPRARNVLGRGLSSLIPKSKSELLALENADSGALMQISVKALTARVDQPRQHFSEEALKELTSSIKEHGVLQPLVVRRYGADAFEIIAGERRFRSAQRAGLDTVPCVVLDIANDDVLKIALVENLQREDLNAIEEAEGYRRLHEELNMTQEQIAQSVGKDRSTIANAMRLLKLPEGVRRLVIDKRVSMGHARALLALRDLDLIEQLADQIAHDGLSVRNTEALVQETLQDPFRSQNNRRKVIKRESPEERAIRRDLETRFGTRVDLRHNKGKGAIVIQFAHLEQFNEILSKLLAGSSTRL